MPCAVIVVLAVVASRSTTTSTSLVKVGEWKVEGVRNLNLGVRGGGTATPAGDPPVGAQATTASPAQPRP